MWGSISVFPVNSGMRQECVLAPSIFNTCTDWVLGNVADQSHCRAFVGHTKVTDIVFANNVVLLTKSLEILGMARGTLRKQSHYD